MIVSENKITRFTLMKWIFFLTLVFYLGIHNLEAQEFLKSIEETFSRIDNALKKNDREEAKKLLKTLRNKSLSDYQKYELHQRLKWVSKQQIGVSYEIIPFLEEYPIQKSWNTVALEYQYNLNKHTLIGRASYSSRFFTDGILYEIDAYPVFSYNTYGFLSVGFSKSGFFQKFSTTASVFNNLGKGFESEMGFRYFNFETESFFTFAGGITKYIGRFYFNGRISLGPNNDSGIFQNYQLATRYYFENAANYLFMRLGTGISPDDISRFPQVISNSSLKAFYGSVGFSKWYGPFGFGTTNGILFENLPNNNKGIQLLSSINLKYRFY